MAPMIQTKCFILIKEKRQVNDLMGIDQTKGEENTVNAGRRSDARPHLIGDEKSVEDSAANRGDKIIFEKELTAPPALQGAAEHPERQHVEEQVEQPAVEKLIGKKLPEVKILPNQVRHQAEQPRQILIEKYLQDEDRGVDDQQKLDGRRDAAAEGETTGLIKHAI